MDSKQILTLNKRQSIVQRIDAMKASFSANKIKDKLSRYHYFGYPSQILIDKLISKIPSNTMDKNSVIAVVNDFGLEVISQLQMLGYTNLILLCTESDDKLYNIIKYMVEKEFNFNKIVRLEESMENKFDLVIANPPYEIGNAVITETMKHCNEAVVLMPLSRYKKNGLFKQIKDITIIPMGEANFEDAATDPHICNLNSSYDNNINYDELQLCSYNQKFIKYYRENLARKHYAIDACVTNTSLPDTFPTCENSFYITERTPCDGIHLITGDSLDVKWNIYRNISVEDIPRSGSMYKGTWIFFKSDIERQNFADYWYSNGKQGLLHNLLRGSNKQGGAVKNLLPKLDWTRPWTDEEILKDYGYTDEEIKEILSL